MVVASNLVRILLSAPFYKASKQKLLNIYTFVDYQNKFIFSTTVKFLLNKTKAAEGGLDNQILG